VVVFVAQANHEAVVALGIEGWRQVATAGTGGIPARNRDWLE
jgi:hypothetical protein